MNALFDALADCPTLAPAGVDALLSWYAERDSEAGGRLWSHPNLTDRRDRRLTREDGLTLDAALSRPNLDPTIAAQVVAAAEQNAVLDYVEWFPRPHPAALDALTWVADPHAATFSVSGLRVLPLLRHTTGVDHVRAVRSTLVAAQLKDWVIPGWLTHALQHPTEWDDLLAHCTGTVHDELARYAALYHDGVDVRETHRQAILTTARQRSTQAGWQVAVEASLDQEVAFEAMTAQPWPAVYNTVEHNLPGTPAAATAQLWRWADNSVPVDHQRVSTELEAITGSFALMWHPWEIVMQLQGIPGTLPQQVLAAAWAQLSSMLETHSEPLQLAMAAVEVVVHGSPGSPLHEPVADLAHSCLARCTRAVTTRDQLMTRLRNAERLLTCSTVPSILTVPVPVLTQKGLPCAPVAEALAQAREVSDDTACKALIALAPAFTGTLGELLSAAAGVAA